MHDGLVAADFFTVMAAPIAGSESFGAIILLKRRENQPKDESEVRESGT
jgi:hypothetical protein